MLHSPCRYRRCYINVYENGGYHVIWGCCCCFVLFYFLFYKIFACLLAFVPVFVSVYIPAFFFFFLKVSTFSAFCYIMSVSFFV